MQKVGAVLTSMDAIPTFSMGLVSRDNPATGSITAIYTWQAGGSDEFGRLYDGTVTANNLATNKIEGDKFYAVRLLQENPVKTFRMNFPIKKTIFPLP